MVKSLYRQDTSRHIHRGAIYEYRPIFWLQPPLWCIRHIRWSQPAQASLYQWSELEDAFRLGAEDNQENVMARAKIRYIVVISNNFYTQHSEFKEVVVMPTYTLKPHKPDFIDRVRNNQIPHLFYIAEDPHFPQMGECYIDFCDVRPLHKAFLGEGKLDIAFTPQAINAIIQRYKWYLSLELTA